jgi:hypothetical protein
MCSWLFAAAMRRRAGLSAVGRHVQLFDYEVSQAVEVGQVRLGSGNPRAAKEDDLALVTGGQQVVGQGRTVK